MESFFIRYRNVTVLLVLLMAQVIALAAQVRRPDNATGESLSLMRMWVVQVVVPAEKAVSAVGGGIRNAWRNYIDLRRAPERSGGIRFSMLLEGGRGDDCR